MGNTETALEKADALTNLVEQMFLAHQIHDETMFRQAHDKAGEIGFDLVQMLSEAESAE